ncbi:sulfotransferase family 2 domain-containing protein [Roseovarius sp. 2305UL8-3]|uniref:sulfotransferase family 2 domain-containing protein n=1 Tax=Roseovarius conchicola TaxID=3121636 RepID=UPI00352803DA
MIISPGRNYIFVHIPKTGGTSLALALEDRAKADDILIGDTPKALRRRRRLKGVQAKGRLWKHSTLADIDELVTPEFVGSAFIFSLVRNPWDRMVSYYHWLRDQGFDHPAVHLAQRLAFDEFVQSPHTRQSFRTHPYSSYLRDATGQDRATHYIRLEHFAEDAAPLWAHLGFRLSLPHENASARGRDYRGYYDDALAEVVGEICAEDIARFGYRFG